MMSSRILLYLSLLIFSLQNVDVSAFQTKKEDVHKIQIVNNLAIEKGGVKGEQKGAAAAAAAFSLEDAKQFVQVLDEKGMKVFFITQRSPDGRVEISLEKMAKFSKEFKQSLKVLADHILVAANSNKLNTQGVAEFNLYLFGSKLSEHISDFSELSERFLTNVPKVESRKIGLIDSLIRFWRAKFKSRGRELEKKWTKFVTKMDQIRKTLKHSELDEEFVDDFADSAHFSLKKGKLDVDEQQMEQKLIEREKLKVKKLFKFDNTERTLENLCELPNAIKTAKSKKSRPIAQIDDWANLKMGEFKCPQDSQKIVQALRNCLLLLEGEESKRGLEMFRSGHFHQWLLGMHEEDYKSLKDLLGKKLGSKFKLFQPRKRLADFVAYRKLKKTLLKPIIQSLAKLGKDKQMWPIKGGLLKVFILELGIALNTKLGKKGSSSLKFADNLKGDSKAFDSQLHAAFDGINAKLRQMENTISDTRWKLV